VPPDPSELLLQADALAGKTGATQADLRRAISTAYYAVFHFCLTVAADMICGAASRSTDRYSFVYRSTDHSRLRGVCDQLRGSKPNVAFTPSGGFGRIADFARNAFNLYEQRIKADYDPSESFTAAGVQIVVSDARQAITWFQSCTVDQQQAFLTLILFKPRPGA
jgi:hypothetical protein